MYIFIKILKLNFKNEYVSLKLKNDINKIININTKFVFYYKYYKKYKYINFFIKSQKSYYILNNFVKKYKFRKLTVNNKYDLLGNEIICNCYNYIDNNIIFRFNYIEIFQYLKHNIHNIELLEDNINMKYLNLVNPYTTKSLTNIFFYNLYVNCKNNNIKIPLYYELFYRSNFNVNKYYFTYENYVLNICINLYVKNIEKDIKYSLIVSAIDLINNFLRIYFFEDDLHTEILNNFSDILLNIDNKFIKIYLSYLYYKSRTNKLFLKQKIYLIVYLLNNKKLKFNKENLNKIEKVFNILINNISKYLYIEIELNNRNSNYIIVNSNNINKSYLKTLLYYLNNVKNIVLNISNFFFIIILLYNLFF